MHWFMHPYVLLCATEVRKCSQKCGQCMYEQGRVCEGHGGVLFSGEGTSSSGCRSALHHPDGSSACPSGCSSILCPCLCLYFPLLPDVSLSVLSSHLILPLYHTVGACPSGCSFFCLVKGQGTSLPFIAPLSHPIAALCVVSCI